MEISKLGLGGRRPWALHESPEPLLSPSSALCWPWREPAPRSPCREGQQPVTCGVYRGLTAEWDHTTPGPENQDVLR